MSVSPQFLAQFPDPSQSDQQMQPQRSAQEQSEIEIPAWLTPRTVDELPKQKPPQLIKGILYQGAKRSGEGHLL